MSIGYACMTLGVPGSEQRSCLLKNADEEKLLEIIEHNLKSLENIIDYNIENKIRLFRISSDLIPFASSQVNRMPWWDIFKLRFETVGAKIIKSGMRVSMHPGQYTVINSPDKEVVKRAIDDLAYHARVLDFLGLSSKHKIILHIGGVYNNKNLAVKRFKKTYENLDEQLKKRLVIENDDRLYSISEVLGIGRSLNIPVVFDNLHNKINPGVDNKSDLEWIDESRKTWTKNDGLQKIHYSQQDPGKKPGSHSATIRINEFIDYHRMLKNNELDIMLEVKDKNLSAVKCINCTAEDENIKILEAEWSRYKYRVLETSPRDYSTIRKLLKDKKYYPAVQFYNLIENAIESERTTGNAVNAAQHIWGYFKKYASEKERADFLRTISDYSKGKKQISSVKNFLWKMANKYHQSYLMNSYYFVIE